MAYKKGISGNPAGRPKGSKNRTTEAMRELIAQLVDDNLGNMSDWLYRMGQEDPKAAFQCMLGLMEFHMPKMARAGYIEEKEPEAASQTTEETDAFLIAIADAIRREQGDQQFKQA